MSGIDIQRIVAQETMANDQRNNRTEIAQLREKQTQSIKALRSQQEEEIYDVRQRNQQDISTEHDRKIKVLEQLKHELSLENQRMEQQKNKLKKDATQQIQLARNNHEDQLNKTVQTYQKKGKEIQEDQRSSLQKLETINDLDQSQRLHEHSMAMQRTSFKNQQDLNEVSKKGSQVIAQTKFTQEQELENLKAKNQQLYAGIRNKHELEVKKVGESHQKENERIQFSQKADLKEKHETFLNQYQQNQKGYNEQHKALESRHVSDVENLKVDQTKSYQSLEVKTANPFYKNTELKPEISNFDHHVEIKMQAPEYEKGNISLNVEGRKIRLSHSRQFKDEVKTPENEKIQTSRVESMSKSFTVSDILDPLTIKKDYRAGQVIFSIKKA
ncbi:MAG: hypothetical protein QE271_12200 [Bacteriovoracaceae bacterium]|nr:hypothetical protein [Bacteriovoracaceae bacterium]